MSCVTHFFILRISIEDFLNSHLGMWQPCLCHPGHEASKIQKFVSNEKISQGKLFMFLLRVHYTLQLQLHSMILK